MYKSQSLIMQIMNQEAAMAEQQAGALISGMIIGTATTAANLGMAAATGGSSAALSGLGGLGSLGGSGGGMGGLGSIGDMASSAGRWCLRRRIIRSLRGGRSPQNLAVPCGPASNKEARIWKLFILDYFKKYLTGS